MSSGIHDNDLDIIQARFDKRSKCPSCGYEGHKRLVLSGGQVFVPCPAISRDRPYAINFGGFKLPAEDEDADDVAKICAELRALRERMHKMWRHAQAHPHARATRLMRIAGAMMDDEPQVQLRGGARAVRAS